MAANIITGIDIGTSSIRVAVCEYKKELNSPVILALVRKPSHGLRRGYVININEVIESIHEAVEEAERVAKIKIKRAYLGIGGVTLESRMADGTVAVTRADLEITKSDIRRALDEAENNLPDMANRTILHRFPIGYKVDGKRIYGQAEEMKGEKLEVRALFITCSKQHLKDFVSAVEENGIVVEDVIASPLASSAAILTKVQRASGCILSNIGSQTTAIAVFEEGIPLSLHIFPIGSTDITNDIALGFKIPLEDAERIKRHETEPVGPKKKLDEIIEARVSDIFEIVEIHLKKIGRNGLLPAGIVLTGGGSNIVNIEEMAKVYFKLPAKVASPTRITSGQNQTIDSSWSVAYGLCIYTNESAPTNKSSLELGTNLKHKIVKWVREFMP